SVPGTSMRNYDGALGWGVDNGRVNGGLSFSISDQSFEIPESVDVPEEDVEIRAQRMAFQGRFGKNWSGRFFDQAPSGFNTTRFHQAEVEIERPSGQPAMELIGLEYEQYAFSSTLTLQHQPVGILARGALGFSLNGQRLD